MKLANWTVRLTLLGIIGGCIYLLIHERRQAAWYRQETDALRASLEDIEITNPNQLWLKYLSATPETTSLLFYIPPRRKLELRQWQASAGERTTLLEIPASRVSRSGLLQIESLMSQPPDESNQIRIFGLSERPIRIQIPDDQVVSETSFIGEQVEIGQKTPKEILAMAPRIVRGVPMLTKLPYIARVFRSSYSPDSGLASGNEYFLFRWRTEQRDMQRIQDDAGILSIVYVDDAIHDADQSPIPSVPDANLFDDVVPQNP